MKYNVIAIEREYASGGQEIGEKLAKKLSIPCYSNEILKKAADKLGLPAVPTRSRDENMTGSLLYMLNMMANAISGNEIELSDEQKLAITEGAIIKDLSLNPCVIIGRGACGFLHDRERVLRVFVYADKEKRKQRAVSTYGIESQTVEAVLNQSDKRRSNYFKATTGLDWRSDRIYDLSLNSGRLSIEAIVELLYHTVIENEEIQ